MLALFFADRQNCLATSEAANDIIAFKRMLAKHLFECSSIMLKKTVGIFSSETECWMYVYQRLKDLREDSDKKQEAIALVLKITRQQYQLYESGKRELPMHHFITLARYYNVSLDYLAGLTDMPKKLY